MLPFERNRFYVGKLLTTADFLAEQNYFNNKRRFFNNLFFGSGILCGLGVYSLDDVSIMVDSGVAIDSTGREVVVENSVVKKLSAIDGFENLCSDRATLCLRYAEKAVHPVYSIDRQGDDLYELNRVQEEWQLFLSDSELLEQELPMETEFFSRSRLYGDGDFAVDVVIPAAVSCGAAVKLTIVIEKLSDAEKSLSLEGVFQIPSFTDRNGEHEIFIRIENVTLSCGEQYSSEHWVTAQSKPSDDSVIIAKPNLLKIMVSGEEKRLEDHFVLKAAVTTMSTTEIIRRELGRTSLEMRKLSGTADYIKLAEITLQMSKSSYIIDKVIEQGVKNYIVKNADESMRLEFASYYGGGESAAQTAPFQEWELQENPVSFYEPIYATGTCEIPLGDRMKKGDVVYSDEIMHGLGKGNVFVDVAFEYIAEDKRTGASEKQTIYGDPELFATDEPPITFASTAVKVFGERGSFMAAAKIQRETDYVLLQLRWVAIKLPSPADQSALQKIAGKSISAVPPTVTLSTRENHFFNVRFKNMEPCTLTYRLTEKDSGEITSEGVYTAPAREGVFEIQISCADMPLVSTYAYAIVKKKENEVEADQK